MPNAPSKLAIAIPPPTSAPAGQSFPDQPTLKVEDEFGNLETSDSSTMLTVGLDSGSGPLQGAVAATVNGGIAMFSNLFDNRAEIISLKFTSGNLADAVTSPITVTAGPATQLVVVSAPAGPLPVNQAFSLTVAAEDSLGNIAPTFTGNVTISISGDTAFGFVSVPAIKGLAAFSGLELNTAAAGQSIQIAASGLAAAAISPNTLIVASPAPIISGPLEVDYTATVKKGKTAGTKSIAGYTVDYSTAMDPASVGDGGNYVVDMFVVKKHGKKKVTVLRPVGFSVSNVKSNSITLMLAGKQRFPQGGEITVKGSSGGVKSAAGVPLVNDEIFVISSGGSESTAPSP